jgi:hypothetical protein
MQKIKVKNISRSIIKIENKFNLTPRTFDSQLSREILLRALLLQNFYKIGLKISGFNAFGHLTEISLVVPERYENKVNESSNI